MAKDAQICEVLRNVEFGKKYLMDLTLYPYDRTREYELCPHTATVSCQMPSSQLYECEQYEQCDSKIEDVRFCLQIYDLKLNNTSK